MTTFSNASSAITSCPFCGPLTVTVDRGTGRTLARNAAGALCAHTFDQRQKKLAADLLGDPNAAIPVRSSRGPRPRRPATVSLR